MRNDVRKLTLCAVLTAAALVTFVIELAAPAADGHPRHQTGTREYLYIICALLAGAWLGLCADDGARGARLFDHRQNDGTGLQPRRRAAGISRHGGAAVRHFGAALWVVSMFGAMAHNLGQMLVARFVAGVAAIWYYLPVLLLSALVTGLFTGLCAQLVLKRLRRGAGRKEKGEST